MFGLVVAGVGGAILIAHAEVIALEQALYKLELRHEQNLRRLEERAAENSAALHLLAAEIAEIKARK